MIFFNKMYINRELEKQIRQEDITFNKELIKQVRPTSERKNK